MPTKRIVTYIPQRTRTASALESLEAPGANPPEPEALAKAAEAIELIRRVQRDPGVMATVQDQYASLLQTSIAKFAPDSQLDAAPGGALEAKFDERDILGWAGSVLTWVKRLTKFTWKEPTGAPAPLAGQARVAVFGDWATGLYGAPVVSKSIARDSRGFQLVLHLGDTYYSGDDEEIEDRLIALWPRAPQAVHRALNGNHEMYTGGEAYLRAVEEQFGQKTSYFAFQNDHWILAGLDTAYSDHDLHGNQAAWLESLLGQAQGRKLILFSHHQPFSILERQGPKLVARLSNLLQKKQIFAWYWGHEHRCAIYDAHPAWGLLGRCVGHGGFPYFRDDLPGGPHSQPTFVRIPSKNLVPGAEILDGPNPYIQGHEAKYGPHGYLTLDFDGALLQETVRDAEGNALRERSLS
jgi:Calcineurin-like phosphoesterase